MVTYKAFVGECYLVQPEMIASWYETSLPTLFSQYKLEDIYKAEKFRLFYQWLTKKTLHLKSNKCSGGKQSKIRITGFAAENAAGDKLPMFVTGKCKMSRCFKNVRSLPCQYRSKGKSWIDNTLFEDKLDGKFLRGNRKFH